MLTPGRADRQRAVGEHGRPLLRCVPAQREGEHPDLLVSWADGPVESSVLGAAGIVGELRRLPLRHGDAAAPPDPRRPRRCGTSSPRPLQARTAPPVVGLGRSTRASAGAALIGAMNVYDSSSHTFNPGLDLRRPHDGGLLVGGGLPARCSARRCSRATRTSVSRRVASDGCGSPRCRRTSRSTSRPSTTSVCRCSTSPCGSPPAPVSRACAVAATRTARRRTVINPGITHGRGDRPDERDGPRRRAQPHVDGATSRTRTSSRPTAPAPTSSSAWRGTRRVQPIFDAKCISCHNGVAGRRTRRYTDHRPDRRARARPGRSTSRTSRSRVDYGTA